MKEKSSDQEVDQLTSPPQTESIFEDLLLSAAARKKLNAAGKWLQNSSRKSNTQVNPILVNTLLFYGPNDFAKTKTAILLGKQAAMEFYPIDLSLVISKYIGETEKNLERLFAEAEEKNWILFFDEADALFGKRTDVKDAHDRYANLDVAYLLQKTESFEGLVILATNQKKSIDPDLIRRLRTSIYFKKPRRVTSSLAFAGNS